MKNTILLGTLIATFTQMAFAQEKLDISKLCQGNVTADLKSELVIMDKGFCEQYLKLESQGDVQLVVNQLGNKIAPNGEINCPEDEKSKDKWKVRLYMSHSFTTYFDTDVTFKSTRYNVTIENYSWAERSSREYFLPKTWNQDGNNPAQIIDEPTNTFVLSLEKDGHEFFLSAFHPKFLQAKDQVKHIKGTIDGVAVDEVAPVNKPFDGYDQVPGESELVRNENTHRQMSFEMGYGHRFKLIDSKFGNISYVPGVAFGVMVGNNYSVMIKENAWWDFEDGADKYGIQGFGGSFTNRLEFNTKKERFGLFYENKLSFYKQNHGFMDGNQKYNLGYMGNSFGMKFMIYNPNNHKKPVTSSL